VRHGYVFFADKSSDDRVCVSFGGLLVARRGLGYPSAFTHSSLEIRITFTLNVIGPSPRFEQFRQAIVMRTNIHTRVVGHSRSVGCREPSWFLAPVS
jgi:hypothetical protein